MIGSGYILCTVFSAIEKIIKLTKNGREQAEAIYEKHIIFTEFFTEIAGEGVGIAKKDAHKI